MAENSKKPRLRFKGFTETWEQRELGKIGSTYTGLSGKSKADFGHGKGKFITYMNVFTNPIANLETVEPIEIDDKQNTVLVGDVFFTTSSETPVEVGMSCVLTENSPNTYLNSFCFGYRPIVKFDNYYLAYMLRSASFREKITFLAQGISRYNISKNKVMEIEIPIPDFNEQQKIGAYFRNIDNLITLHQRKYDKFVAIKKALLEKMFPRVGKNVPEIRFKGFTETWEQRKLDKVAQYRNGKAHEDSISDKGKYIVVNSKFVSTNGEVIKFSTVQNEPLYENEIAFVLSDVPNGRAIARTFLVNKNGVYTLNQRIAGITPLDNTYPYYLYILMNRHKYFLQFDDGAKQTNLSIKDVLGFESLYPNYKEQQQIGLVFERLDNLITLHQRQLERLKNIKSALLEKMFI